MNHFLDNAQDYYDAGMDVTPLNGKRPFVEDWLNVNLEGVKLVKNKYEQMIPLSRKNIGLKTGKISGVICVDVDLFDLALKEKVYKKLGPCLCGKIGNKSKGINYFFKYNGEESRAFKGIDILSDGKQTVLPPSMHDEGYAYEWVGVELLEAEALENMPNGFIEWCEKEFGNGESVGLTKSDGSRCNHGSHTRLSKIGKAMFEDGATAQEIADSLILEDGKINDTLSYFLCGSRKWKCDNLEINALGFAVEFFKGKIPKQVKVTIGEPVKKELPKLPHLRGIAGEMFDYIYNNSPVPRSRFAYASALTAISMIIGNRIRFGNIHPNLYSLLICPSGGGKDFPMKFPKKMLTDNNMKTFLGQENPASDTGVLMTLSEQPKRLDTIDEADILFGSINASNSPWASKMADVYASLYTSCGGYYAGKVTAGTKRVGECENPFITMIGSITPAAFRGSVTMNNIEKGLGARFMYFIDERFKKATLRHKETEMPRSIEGFCKIWQPPEISLCVPEIDIEPEALKDLQDYHDKIQVIREKKQDSKLVAIYNRMYEHAVTLLLIDTCSTQPLTCKPIITRDNVAWSMRAINAYIEQMKVFVNDNVAGSEIERARQSVVRAIRKCKNSATKTEITRNTRQLYSSQRDMLLKELVEGETLEVSEYTNKKTGRKSKLYTLTGE